MGLKDEELAVGVLVMIVKGLDILRQN